MLWDLDPVIQQIAIETPHLVHMHNKWIALSRFLQHIVSVVHSLLNCHGPLSITHAIWHNALVSSADRRAILDGLLQTSEA